MDGFSPDDLVVDRELADIEASFRFLLDVTPVDLVAARTRFHATGEPPDFTYRPLSDDPVLSIRRLEDVAVEAVTDATLASLLMAKQRELRLQLEMLCCRGSSDFLPLSIELYGGASPALLQEAQAILTTVPAPPPDTGPWLDAEAFVVEAQTELDHYRAVAPDMESHVEIREGSTGLMVSRGDLLVAPTVRIAAARVEALIHHEIGTHVTTYVNGAAQPLHVLASGLAGADETQEGLAVLAEHLVGGLTAGRLRQLAARVVAVHEMMDGATFSEVHAGLVEVEVPRDQAFTITTRVFRSGGLTKDAVYLRGLHELVDHLGAGGDLEVLWLGKMPLSAVPLVADLHRRGALTDPLLRPRFLDDPRAHVRLAALQQVRPLTALIGEPS
jgi:uncharacterized protein (TIGR02421 family)